MYLSCCARILVAAAFVFLVWCMGPPVLPASPTLSSQHTAQACRRFRAYSFPQAPSGTDGHPTRAAAAAFQRARTLLTRALLRPTYMHVPQLETPRVVCTVTNVGVAWVCWAGAVDMFSVLSATPPLSL